MKDTEITVKLLPLADSLEESEAIINKKISDLRKQDYFINSVSVSEGVAVLMLGRNVK